MDEATTRLRLRDLLEEHAPEVGVEEELSTVVDDHIALIRQKCGGEWDNAVAAEYVSDLQKTLDPPPEPLFDENDDKEVE